MALPPFGTTTSTTPNVGESTLSITRAELRSAVLRYLGWTTVEDDLSAEQQADLERIVRSAERQFYLPNGGHVWSFLRPEYSKAIVAGTNSYDLPDDFGAFTDPYLSFSLDDNYWCPLKLIGPGELKRLQQKEPLAASAQPTRAAVQPKTSDRTAGQRFKLVLFPTPTESATIKGVYHSVPFAISDTAPYPLGGQNHAETLLASALAAAELLINDDRSIHRETFHERLAASIAYDKSHRTPPSLGYNGDASTWSAVQPIRSERYVSVGGQFFLGPD